MRQTAWIVSFVVLASLHGAVVAWAAPAASGALESWDSTVQFEASGAPGEWVLFYHEIPKPAPDWYTVIYNFEFTTGGDGVPFMYALTPPRFMFERGVFPGLYDFPLIEGEGLPPRDLIGELRVYREPEGDERAFSLTDYPNVIGLEGLAGVVFFAASTAPWHANVTLQFLEGRHFSARPVTGPYLPPTFVSHGSNASFYSVDDNPLVSPSIGVTSASFGYDMPGWTHVQYNWHSDDTLYRGMHQHQYRFPNGFHYLGPQISPRADLRGQGLPINVEPGPVRAVGTMLDAPGTLEATVVRADLAVDVSILAFHIPSETDIFPSEFQRMSYGCEMLQRNFNDKPASGGHACNEERIAGTPQPI